MFFFAPFPDGIAESQNSLHCFQFVHVFPIRIINKGVSRTPAFYRDKKTHGIIKKTDKVPKSEIERARQIMKKYFEQRKKNK